MYCLQMAKHYCELPKSVDCFSYQLDLEGVTKVILVPFCMFNIIVMHRTYCKFKRQKNYVNFWVHSGRIMLPV